MPKLTKVGSREVSPCHQVNKQSVSILYCTKYRGGKKEEGEHGKKDRGENKGREGR